MTTNEKLIVSATASDSEKLTILADLMESILAGKPEMTDFSRKCREEHIACARSLVQTGTAFLPPMFSSGKPTAVTAEQIIHSLKGDLHIYGPEGTVCRLNAAGDIGFFRELKMTNHAQRSENFDVRDSKGRMVGGSVTTWDQEHISGEFLPLQTACSA